MVAAASALLPSQSADVLYGGQQSKSQAPVFFKASNGIAGKAHVLDVI